MRPGRRQAPKGLLRHLEALALAFAAHDLEAVLIGSAAARLQGERVTPRDLDFLWRPTAVQRARLKAVAAALGATITRPFYRRGLRFKLTGRGWSADFLATVDGVSAAGVTKRAAMLPLGATRLWTAALTDVLHSRSARRSRGILPPAPRPRSPRVRRVSSR